jgi:hypothetical protein
MGKLKPLGSEKLTGQERLDRIMEIARYNEVPKSETNTLSTTEYSINVSDGIEYQIVKEKMGYVIKKNISESEVDYVEPMRNRKYYNSYSQALKRLNLIIKESNRLNGQDEEISLFGEQKKFVLKTPKSVAPEMDDMPPSPPAAPPSVPSPELPPSPDAAPEGDVDASAEEMPSDDMGGMDDEMGGGMEDEMPSEGGEEVTFKMIQKLTGKLTQKIREYEGDKGLTSENIKYVINMVLSSLDLANLSEEDKEDVLSKFESDEDMDMGDDDMDMGDDEMGAGDEDITSDSEVEDIQSNMDVAVEGEMEESMYGSFGNMRRKDFKGDNYYDENDRGARDFDIQGIGGDDFDVEEFDSFQKLYDKYGDKQKWFNKTDGERMFNLYKEKTGKPFKVKTKKFGMDEEGYGNGAIMDSIFGESKIDKVISKYFEITESEKIDSQERKVVKEVAKKSNIKKKMESVKKLSESIEQELSSQKFLEENADFTFLGKTNKKNLVFEGKSGQYKITPEGLVI